MKIEKNDVIGGIIVVIAVVVSSIIAGMTFGGERPSPPPVPRKPFVVFVTREVQDE